MGEERAVHATWRSVQRTPEGHPDMPGRLSNLGTELHERFKDKGDMEGLERAIHWLRRSTELTPEDHPAFPGRLTRLGNAWQTKLENTGDIEDLEQVLHCIERFARLSPGWHPAMQGRLDSLAHALKSRFMDTGDMKDLELVLYCTRRSLQLTPEEHIEMPGRLNDIGSALQARFNKAINMDDLEQSIHAFQRSIMLTPKGHPHLPGRLNNLGNALQTRFENTGIIDDLEQAIHCLTRSIELTPKGHPDVPRWRTDLGNALQRRSENRGNMDNLDSEQVTHSGQGSVELSPEVDIEDPVHTARTESRASTSHSTEDSHTGPSVYNANGVLGGARNFRIDNSHFTDITYNGPADAVSAGTAVKMASLSAIAAASVTANVALYRELRREQSISAGASKAEISSSSTAPTDCSIGDPGNFMQDQYAYTTLSGVVDMLSGGQSQSCLQINGTSGTTQHFLRGFAHLDIKSTGDPPPVASTISLLICITNSKFKFRKTRQMVQASSVVF